jgi:hypothetical protein
MERTDRLAVVTAHPRTGHRTRPTTRSVARGAGAARATYLRRRLVVVMLGVAFVVVTAQAGVALGSASLAAPERRPASASQGGGSHVITVTVAPGDSLWSIARRVAPDEDPREVVDELDQARHGAPLVPGDTISWAG